MNTIASHKNANQMREHIKGVRGQLDAIMSDLKQLEEEMSKQGMNPTSLGEYIVHFFSC